MSKYWTDTINAKKDECIISIKDVKDIESDIEKAQSLTDKALTDLQTAEENYKQACKDKKNIQQRGLERTQAEKDYRLAKEKVDRLKLTQTVIIRNQTKSLKVERLKDIYTRKENLCITLLTNGIDDGKIVTTIGKLNNDIHGLDEYGVYLLPPYYDDLKKILMDKYYELTPIEKEFIDNSIPQNTVMKFASLCKRQILDNNIAVDNGYYNVPVKDFKTWHTDSLFRRFSITELKEALILHGYCRSNSGRNDYTDSKMGKTVSFYASKLEELKDNE